MGAATTPTPTEGGAVHLGLSLSLSAARPPAAPAGPTLRGTPATGIGGNPTLGAVGAGDTLLVAAVYAAGATPTATGWTRIVEQNEGAGDYRLVVFKKENAVGNETALSPSANPVGPWVAAAYRGALGVDSVAST